MLASTSGDTLKLVYFVGNPQFQITPQATAQFAADPSGQPVTVAGSAGARIVMTGFRGDTINYSGPTKLASTGPLLLEVALIGDFEGTVTWAVGLSAPGCAIVTTSGNTMTLQFVKSA